MNRLSGEFQTDLPLPDALAACAEALHGLGWPIETVEASRVVSRAGPAAEDPPTVEVNLTESEGETTLRITGSDSEANPLDREALVAVLDKARDAIKDSLESASAASSSPEQSSEPKQSDGEPTEKPAADEPEEENAESKAPAAASGWYPDAYDSARLQYWDGVRWTGDYRPVEGAGADDAPEPHAEAEPRTDETKFRSLHVIAGIYGALGWLVAIFGSIAVVVAAVQADNDNSSASPGLVLLLGLLGVGFYVLLLFGISAAIRLALAVEDNTRSTVALLKRRIDGE
jgi:hypothetical protein